MSKSHIRPAAAPAWASQNFLTSTKTIERLLSATTLCETDRVLEIGPGKGHITRALARRCRSVLAVEVDPALCARLRQGFAGEANIRIVLHDFLAWRLPDKGEYKVFSNIPFSRTTDIVRHLTECPNPPTEAWLLMEKGAAMRFMGTPRESLRSLMLKPGFELEIIDHLRRQDFHPMPSVDVVMLRLARKQTTDISRRQMASYERFVRAALQNGPSSLLSKRQIQTALQPCGQNDRTAGEMLYVQWLCLFRCFAGLKPGGKK